MVERLLCMQKVRGSMPLVSKTFGLGSHTARAFFFRPGRDARRPRGRSAFTNSSPCARAIGSTLARRDDDAWHTFCSPSHPSGASFSVDATARTRLDARAPRPRLAAHARPGSFAAPEHESPEPPKAPRDATAPRGVERDATARNVPSRVARTGGARARWRVRTEASRRDDVRGGDADGGLRVRAVPRRVHRARGASRLRRLSAARGRRQGGRASRERRAARLRCAWRPGVARPSAALAARALDPPTRRRGASLPARVPARTSPAPPRSRRERVRARPRRLEGMRAPLIHSSPRTGTPPPRRSRSNARTRVSEIRNADATPPGPQTSSPHQPSLPLF